MSASGGAVASPGQAAEGLPEKTARAAHGTVPVRILYTFVRRDRTSHRSGAPAGGNRTACPALTVIRITSTRGLTAARLLTWEDEVSLASKLRPFQHRLSTAFTEPGRYVGEARSREALVYAVRNAISRHGRALRVSGLLCLAVACVSTGDGLFPVTEFAAMARRAAVGLSRDVSGSIGLRARTTQREAPVTIGFRN